MEFIRLLERRRISLAFLSEDVKQHRLLLRLQKFKCPDEQRNVVSIDRSIIAQAELLKDDAWHDETFDAFLHFVCELNRIFAGDRPHEVARLVV